MLHINNLLNLVTVSNDAPDFSGAAGGKDERYTLVYTNNEQGSRGVLSELETHNLRKSNVNWVDNRRKIASYSACSVSMSREIENNNTVMKEVDRNIEKEFRHYDYLSILNLLTSYCYQHTSMKYLGISSKKYRGINPYEQLESLKRDIKYKLIESKNYCDITPNKPLVIIHPSMNYEVRSHLVSLRSLTITPTTLECSLINENTVFIIPRISDGSIKTYRQEKTQTINEDYGNRKQVKRKDYTLVADSSLDCFRFELYY